MTKNVKNKTIKKKRALLIAFMIFALAVLAAVCVYETELNKLDSNNRVDNSFYDSQFKNKKLWLSSLTRMTTCCLSGRCFLSCIRTALMCA